MTTPAVPKLPYEGWVAPSAVFDGTRLCRDHGVRFAKGRVAEIAVPPADALHLPDILAPGFVDLQVNGGGGVLFNTSPTVAGLKAIAAAHRQGGTARLLPTVITDTPEVLATATDAVLAAHGGDGIAGIHIEGPHINVRRRGTHRAASIRPYDDATDRQISRLRAAGIPVMLTLAPECQPPGVVADLARRGVVVSLGHSAASYEEAETALHDGARAFTHLMNAMPPMENRNPGIIAAALNSDAWCGVIFDGVHVAPPMLRLIMNARSDTSRIFAVTDAMPTLFGPDRFTLYDGVEVRREGGRLVNPEGGLAGAHVSMLESLAMLVNTLGLPLEAGLAATITTPCKLMGLNHDLLDTPVVDCLRIAPDLGHCRFG